MADTGSGVETSPQAATPVEPQNGLENTARALCRFGIGIALLPISLFFTKPGAVATAISTDRHTRTPPPFMLALVTGVVVSGVIGNLGKLGSVDVEATIKGDAAPSSFSKAVFDSYLQSTDIMKALLLAIPYIMAIWICAGLISLFMGRGLRCAEPIFAFLSLSNAALAGICALATFVIYLANGSESVILPLFLFSVFYTIVVIVKFVRFLFALKSSHKWSWVGAVLASIPGALITLFFSFAMVVVAVGVGMGLSSHAFAGPEPGAVEPGAVEAAPTDAPVVAPPVTSAPDPAPAAPP